MEEKNTVKANSKAKVKGIMTEDELKKKKDKRTKTALSVFVLLLAIGLGGNWYWQNSDISSKINTIVSSDKTLGEATYVDAPTEITTKGESDYFSAARVDRQTTRDEALEQLQMVIAGTDESEESRLAASQGVARLTANMEIENKIETLVQAKGVNNCLAVINEEGTRVDVIIDTEELTDELILQIKEISMQQLQCSFENVTIIQSN
ncbi:MAG: SpoIIIAH-like family protein [Eubacterium sp.]|nr:SpoIIIAH-like family protein [Eubacterium sp.]